MPVRVCSKCKTKFETESRGRKVLCPDCQRLEAASALEARTKPRKSESFHLGTCPECGKEFMTEDKSSQVICPECRSARHVKTSTSTLRQHERKLQPPFPGVNLDLETQRRALTRFLEIKRTRPRLQGKRLIVCKELGIPFEELSRMLSLYYGTEAKPPRPKADPSRRPKASPFLIPEIKGKPRPVIARQDGFQIEKAYFAEIDENKEKRPWRQIVKAVSERSGKPFETVAHWLMLLHSSSKSMRRKLTRDSGIPDLVQKQVLELYREYLRGDHPPELPLHQHIANKVGLTKRQVHLLLLDYRLNLRRERTLVAI